jgi:hypothetical protein
VLDTNKVCAWEASGRQVHCIQSLLLPVLLHFVYYWHHKCTVLALCLQPQKD